MWKLGQPCYFIGHGFAKAIYLDLFLATAQALSRKADAVPSASAGRA